MPSTACSPLDVCVLYPDLGLKHVNEAAQAMELVGFGMRASANSNPFVVSERHQGKLCRGFYWAAHRSIDSCELRSIAHGLASDKACSVSYFMTITAPVFFSAGLYLALSTVAQRSRSGAGRLPLRPRTIVATFVTIDVVTIALQVVGAALIGVAESSRASGDHLSPPLKRTTSSSPVCPLNVPPFSSS